MVKSGEGKSSFWSGASAPIFPTRVALFPRNLTASFSVSAASQRTTSQGTHLLHRTLGSSTHQALQFVGNHRTKISSPSLRQPPVLYGCGRATVLAVAYLYPGYSVFGYALGTGLGAVRPPVQRLCYQQSTSTSPADAISTGKTLHHWAEALKRSLKANLHLDHGESCRGC